ncbi:hypothetical protein CMK11_02865, partial [Candidatus Poribacteria bacterium]|nr:hypothetical protein [Candidatus Poribacteria bacterium]
TAFNFTLDDFLSQASAQAMVSNIDTAVTTLATIRTDVGAFQNRIERSQANIQSAMENTQNSESTIRDADFAATRTSPRRPRR